MQQHVDQEIAQLLANWRSALEREWSQYGKSTEAAYSEAEGHHAVITHADGRQQIIQHFADAEAAESHCADYREQMGW
jgi:hypothetical protein